MILHGDCLAQLKEFPDNYFHAVVTDPPYGLAFMGKKWDYDVPSVEIWKEVLRVLRPGGHVLSFGGTRTYHRMVVNIEDAGFEIRDMTAWLYGSGFPKSLDVSKAIDKAAGTKGEKYIDQEFLRRNPDTGQSEKGIINKGLFDGEKAAERFRPGCDDAKLWEGWGTALKPAHEPICLARKPLEKGLTVAENVLKWGVGALNIDASRISTEEKLSSGRHTTGDQQGPSGYKTSNRTEYAQNKQGRWPANVLFDEAAAEMLDAQSGTLKSGARTNAMASNTPNGNGVTHGHMERKANKDYAADFGGASRFFYVAKASKSERSKGVEAGNNHPTVKPVKLMEYLVCMITPEAGIVLDPFCGSGTTGVAAVRNGFGFIGIEREKEYVAIAERRIEAVA